MLPRVSLLVTSCELLEDNPLPVHDSAKTQAQFVDIKAELSNLNGLVKHLEEGMSKMSENITTGMKKSWVEALYGEEFPAFDPNVSYKGAKKAVNDANAAEIAAQAAEQPTVTSVIKQAVREQQLEGIIEEQSKADIRKELEDKMQPLMQEGGVVFGLDHRIPNETPLENYRYYVDTGREILGLPPRTPEERARRDRENAYEREWRRKKAEEK